MKAVITGENDELIGLNLRDNAGVEHLIEMDKKGEITGHQQDGYTDHPDNRTEDENEHVNQTRRFAKYYVYAKRGYDTLERAENPVYIDTVRQAIGALSLESFEQLFGPIHQQLRSHHDRTVDRPRELPAAVRYPDDVVYKQAIYLGVDPRDTEFDAQARTLASEHDLDLDEGMTTQTLADIPDRDLEQWQAFAADLAEEIEPAEVDATMGLEDGAVSGIHVSYPDANGELVTDRAADPLERQPDATLELLTADPGSLEDFKAYLDHHLKCQVRDCFVGMGLVPPEEFRVLGPGKFIYTRRYNHYDLYPELHSSQATPGRLYG